MVFGITGSSLWKGGGGGGVRYSGVPLHFIVNSNMTFNARGRHVYYATSTRS